MASSRDTWTTRSTSLEELGWARFVFWPAYAKLSRSVGFTYVGMLLVDVCLLPLIDDDQQPQIHSGAGEVSEALLRLREHIGQNTEDSEIDTECEEFIDSDEKPSDIAEDLKTDVQCLLDFGYRFHEKAIHHASKSHELAAMPTDQVSEMFIKTDTLVSTFTDRIRERYPSCMPGLVELLGNAQRDRFIRCQEIKDKNRQERLPGSSLVETSAPSTIFHDSGLGTSVPTGSQYADTIVSYAGGQGGSVRIPPLPENASQRTPFECIGCEKMVVLTNESAWKRHLFKDLQPYICLDNDCGDGMPTFPTRAQWKQHSTLIHANSIPWQSSQCPICLGEMPEETSRASSHLAEHLEQIALIGLPTTPYSAEGADSLPDNLLSGSSIPAMCANAIQDP
ncbi:Transcription factor c2h2 [Apiospora phragmitis]|uniref:Transcription factor c2h2 n=1 Tax=Apiospora phragmitis TaxID=2905665 RepID=A0ABR1WTB5_9PEZI